MKIAIDISKHCIRSGARSAYEACLKRCLSLPPAQAGEMEDALEVLKSFLESTDFADLRARHPALAGGVEDRALLHVTEQGGFLVEVQGQRIIPRKV